MHSCCLQLSTTASHRESRRESSLCNQIPSKVVFSFARNGAHVKAGVELEVQPFELHLQNVSLRIGHS